MLRPQKLGKNVRMSFSKIEAATEMPNLIEVQKDSYKWFLKEGLNEVLRDVSPIVDYTGNLSIEFLMPGFKNAHTHTAMVFLRSLADDMPLDRWLSEQVWPNEAKLDEEAVYDLTRLGILEYLSSGITASFDMYVKNEANARANIDSGFRTVLCAALNNFDKDVENIEREYQRFNAIDPLVSYRLGIHAEYTTSMERMEYMAGLAEKYREGCFTHLCETKAETEGCFCVHVSLITA